MCHACACIGAERFPIGGIGGYKRLTRALPGHFADRNKIPSPPRDPRRAAGPDDYGTEDSGQGKKKLRKRLEDLDSPRVLQAEYDKRQRREELLCAINKEAKGEPLSAVLCVARAKSSKKAAPLEEKRVDIQQNDSVDQATPNNTVGSFLPEPILPVEPSLPEPPSP